MELSVLFITGLSVGLVSAFFGIGGGAIMIPVLYTLFPKLPPASIISISLGAIVLNSALNNWRFHQKGIFPNRKNAAIIWSMAALGALVGAQLLYMLPAHTLKRVFGFLLLAMATRVLLAKGAAAKSPNSEPRPVLMALTCLVGAFVSSITGLGGGAIFVPFFLGLVKLPVHLISPYSNAAMMAASLVGLLPHFFVSGKFELKSDIAQNAFIGHVNILFILCLFAGAYFSSKLGVRLHASSKASTKKWLLTALLFVLATRILLAN